jgi:hypothetical protein
MWYSNLKQVVRETFEKLALKLRHDRIHWRIAVDDRNVIQTLEDPQSEDVCKVCVRQIFCVTRELMLWWRGIQSPRQIT